MGCYACLIESLIPRGARPPLARCPGLAVQYDLARHPVSLSGLRSTPISRLCFGAALPMQSLMAHGAQHGDIRRCFTTEKIGGFHSPAQATAAP